MELNLDQGTSVEQITSRSPEGFSRGRGRLQVLFNTLVADVDASPDRGGNFFYWRGNTLGLVRGPPKSACRLPVHRSMGLWMLGNLMCFSVEVERQEGSLSCSFFSSTERCGVFNVVKPAIPRNGLLLPPLITAMKCGDVLLSIVYVMWNCSSTLISLLFLSEWTHDGDDMLAAVTCPSRPHVAHCCGFSTCRCSGHTRA